MGQDVLERILQRAKELGLTPRAASLASGLSATAVRDLVRRPETSPSLATIRKFAAGLQTTPEWLAYGNADGPAPETSQSVLANDPASGLIRASYGGVVEAGAFRPVDDEQANLEVEPIFVPRDPRFPQAQLFVFDVAGDSMNDLKPRPILPGDRLLCLDLEMVRIPMRDGMVVIVEQVLAGGHLRERSVKQVELYEDRVEFCPRSRNPRHKPIVVPRDRQADDGRTVSAIAIVRSQFNDIPMG